MVNSYSFGRMEIDGKVYTSDLIAYPDMVNASWWRKTGHRLSLEDIDDILGEDFDVLVIGTGYLGLMKVDKEVVQFARSSKFELIIAKTANAVHEYNKLSGQKKVIAAFHLTC